MEVRCCICKRTGDFDCKAYALALSLGDTRAVCDEHLMQAADCADFVNGKNPAPGTDDAGNDVQPSGGGSN